MNKLNNIIVSIIAGSLFSNDLHAIRKVCRAWKNIRAIRYSIVMNNNDGDHELQQEINDLYSQISVRKIVCGRNITNISLQIITGFVNLQTLSLYCCVNLTDNGIQHLKELVNLQSLNLYNCYNLTDSGIQHLKEHFKELVIVH